MRVSTLAPGGRLSAATVPDRMCRKTEQRESPPSSRAFSSIRSRPRVRADYATRALVAPLSGHPEEPLATPGELAELPGCEGARPRKSKYNFVGGWSVDSLIHRENDSMNVTESRILRRYEHKMELKSEAIFNCSSG